MKNSTTYRAGNVASVAAALCGVFVALTVSGAEAGKQGAPITSVDNADIFVHGFTLVTEGGRSLDWSSVTNRILVGKRGVDRYFNVYSISPDGVKQECLTLGKERGARRQHNGCASWHPEGDRFVFTSQNQGSTSYRMSMPGMGLNCNLWLADKSGSQFWQLTEITTSFRSPKGVAFPVFSPDGSKLLWAGNTGEYGNEHTWGERALYLADFALDGKEPKLTNTKVLQPGDRPDFYEPHGFSPDGKAALFSANPRKGQSVAGMDICTLDVATEELSFLTDTPEVWDEFASYSPDGKKIVWMSNTDQGTMVRTFGPSKWQRYLRSELWIMDSNGENPKQLTSFNTRGSRHYLGRRSFLGDNAWSADGQHVVVCVNTETRGYTIESRIYLLRLGEGPPPEAAPQTKTDQTPVKRTPEPSKPATSPRRPGVPVRY